MQKEAASFGVGVWVFDSAERVPSHLQPSGLNWLMTSAGPKEQCAASKVRYPNYTNIRDKLFRKP